MSSTQTAHAQDDTDMQDENARLMRELFGPEDGYMPMDDEDVRMNDRSSEEEEGQMELEDGDIHMNDLDSEGEEDGMEKAMSICEEDEQ